MTCGSGTIEQKIGDDNVITITFTDSAAVAIDITGATVFFTVKKNVSDLDSEAIISKDITTHSDPTNGITTFTVTSVESGVLEVGNYYYDLRLKQASGLISSIKRGVFSAVQTITRRTT